MGIFDDHFDQVDDWERKDDGDPASFGGCVLVKKSDSGKAWFVRFPGKRRPHWVPVSQMTDETTLREEGGEGTLVVTGWLRARWGDEGFDPDEADPLEGGVAVPDVVCLRDPPKSKAILCRIKGEEVWVPRSQILDTSEVRGDGDVGRLVVTEWIADQKGLDGEAVTGQRADPRQGTLPGTGGKEKKPARREKPRTAQDDIMEEPEEYVPGPNDDEDLPF